MVHAPVGTGGSRSPRPWTQLPEPDRFWIRYAPRAWSVGPAPDGLLWLDLARGHLGAPLKGGKVGEAEEEDGPRTPLHPLLPAGPFDDVVYVPPVAPGEDAARAVRDGEVAELIAAGTPVVLHMLPGDPSPPEGATGVVDLLDSLVEGRLDELSAIPPGTAAAVWPLVGGLTDDEDLVERGLRRLAEAGVRMVQPVAPDLPPADRRRLAEGRDEGVFDALFHGPPADPRPFSRRARELWARPDGPPAWESVVFLRRPLPRPPLGGASQREVAGLLLVAGELEGRLGRHGRGQVHFRAARWIDRTQYDLKVLAEEGNLEVIPWLDPASRRIIEEWARSGSSASVDRLGEEYLAGGTAGGADGLSTDR